ncbi:MAG: amylosucrase [Eubacterium sp.]|nr:amylosucrase [Eubacterium sp.]
MDLTPAEKKRYKERLEISIDELKYLYMEIYDDETMFDLLCQQMEAFYTDRRKELKKLDRVREVTTNWYRCHDRVGMQISVDNYAGSILGLEKKLNYIQKLGVNTIELFPILEGPGGSDIYEYAVSNYRKVRKNIGSIDDLYSLTDACHKKGINLIISLDMNHTSNNHIWAKKAIKGHMKYKDYYIFIKDYDLVNAYDEFIPQVLPERAPGNFTYIPELKSFVMTTFYSDNWDLNYKNPAVFNEMVENLLFLTNQGADIIKLDRISYIWKEAGTTCRNNHEIHNLIRMIRLIMEIVCPGTALLGHVESRPETVLSYFGSDNKPECHMLYNYNMMGTVWHTIATRNCKLVKNAIDLTNTFPKSYTFLNYIRNADEITWDLNFDLLNEDSIEKESHINYLNKYFTGKEENSDSIAILYNRDPISKPSGICGTTASLTGIEKARMEHDDMMMDYALREFMMHHMFLFMNTGIPMIYAGDEIGTINDYSYKSDQKKSSDARYVQRGPMNWKDVQTVRRAGSIQNLIYDAMLKLIEIKKTHRAFSNYADTWTMDTWDAGTLAMGRYYDGEKIIAIFNYTESDRTAWINEDDGDYVELFTNHVMKAVGVDVPAYSFKLLMKDFNS